MGSNSDDGGDCEMGDEGGDGGVSDECGDYDGQGKVLA